MDGVKQEESSKTFIGLVSKHGQTGRVSTLDFSIAPDNPKWAKCFFPHFLGRVLGREVVDKYHTPGLQVWGRELPVRPRGEKVSGLGTTVASAVFELWGTRKGGSSAVPKILPDKF